MQTFLQALLLSNSSAEEQFNSFKTSSKSTKIFTHKLCFPKTWETLYLLHLRSFQSSKTWNSFFPNIKPVPDPLKIVWGRKFAKGTIEAKYLKNGKVSWFSVLVYPSGSQNGSTRNLSLAIRQLLVIRKQPSCVYGISSYVALVNQMQIRCLKSFSLL